MTSSEISARHECPQAFVEAVVQAAATLGWQFSSADPDGLEFVNPAGGRRSIGLRKFFQRFQDADPAEWPARVAEYLRLAMSVASTPANNDLNAQADRVLVRLGRPIPRAPGLAVWSRPLPETDLAVLLVIEEGRGLRFVHEEWVSASGKSGDEWYERGLANLRRRTPSGPLQVRDAESGLLGGQVGDDHDGTRALLVESLLPAPAPFGVLAAAPDRNTVLALQLNRKGLAGRSLALLHVLAKNCHAEATHPLSPDVFWVKNGVWRRFGIELGQDGIAVQPPKEFAGAWQVLMGAL
jgi:hypothetical protein